MVGRGPRCGLPERGLVLAAETGGGLVFRLELAKFVHIGGAER